MTSRSLKISYIILFSLLKVNIGGSLTVYTMYGQVRHLLGCPGDRPIPSLRGTAVDTPGFKIHINHYFSQAPLSRGELLFREDRRHHGGRNRMAMQK